MADWERVGDFATTDGKGIFYFISCSVFIRYLLDCFASVSSYVCFSLGQLKVFKCIAEISRKGY